MFGLLLPFLKSKLAAFGAVIVIILIIVIGGPMILGQKWRLWCYLAAAVILVGFLIYLVVKAWRARKNARMLEGFLQKQADDQVLAAQPDVKDELGAIKEKLDGAVAVLKRSRIARGRRGSEALYVLPWYMIIGPSAAGKSTMLRNSGLQFPAVDAQGDDGGRLKGLGGTRNCDWWLSSEGILLDTAGRYTISAQGAGDREEWASFLQMLKKVRRRAPINGLILAVAIDEILKQDDEGLDSLARSLRSRIDELIVQLEILFPIYVVFTKCDLIAGFTEYCGDFGRREREQVWGYTRRYEAAREPLHEEFIRETGSLAAVLEQRRLRQLAASVRPAQKHGAYLFPIEFSATTHRLARFVEVLFAPNPYQQNPMVRGFYFNSGTQEGTPIAQVMAAMQRDFGLGSQALPSEPAGETKPFFIKDLFQQIILPDEAKATPLSSSGRRRRLLRAAVNLAQAALAALVILALFTSYMNNRGANAELARTAREVAIALPMAGGFDLNRLDTLDLLHSALARAERGPGLMRRWGLYSGAPVMAAAREVYFRKYQDLFLRPLDRELKARLRNPPALETEAGINQFFQTATAYQMVTLHYDSISHNASELKSAADSIWRSSVDPDDASRLEWLLEGQCRYYMKHRPDTLSRWMRLPPDQALLDEANRVMANFWTIDRLYRRIVNDASGELGHLSMLEIAPGTIRLAGGEIGRAFTREGWDNHLAERIDTMPDEIGGNPVLKQAFEGYEDDQIREQLTQRYADEFRAVWRAFLDEASIVSFADLTDAVDGLDELSQDNSAMIMVLKRLFSESRLDLDGRFKRAIDEEFVPIGRFLGETVLPEGATPGQASYLEMMSAMPKAVEAERDNLQQSAKCALRLRSLNTSFDQAKRRIERLVTGSAAGRSAAAFLVRPLNAARSAAYADVCACLNRTWEERVAKDFRANLGDVYPFNRSSQTEASQSQVSIFFGTGGIFAYEDDEAVPARQEGIRLAGEYENAVRAAEAIRRVMPGGRPSVTFTLRAKAEWMSGLRKTRFEFGGRAFEFTPGQDMTRDYRWPNPGNNDAHLSIVLVDQTLYATPKSYPGDWAIFRLFDEAERSNEVCSWEFPTRAGPSFTVRYALSGDGAEFIRSGHFSRFRCPSRVCQ